MAVYPAISQAIWNYRSVSPRRVQPFILAAIHITDNLALMSAASEAIYSNRVGSGASFHFVVNRNGTVVQCADPVSQVAWTNGSWRNPNWALWTVVKAVTQGYGANDACFMTIENVGSERIGAPLTAAQKEACAKLVAWGRKISGIVPSRATVIAHGDADSVDRRNCPTGTNREGLLNGIVSRANQILKPAPVPTGPSMEASEVALRYRQVVGTKIVRAGKPWRTQANASKAPAGHFAIDTPVRLIGRFDKTGAYDDWYVVDWYRGNGYGQAIVTSVDFK